MTATCIHCHVVITLPPIIGADAHEQQIEFYKKLVVHLNQAHQKLAGELLKATLSQIAGVEVTLLNLAGTSQFTSYDPDWGKNQVEAFGAAEKIFEEFRPKAWYAAREVAPLAKEPIV